MVLWLYLVRIVCVGRPFGEWNAPDVIAGFETFDAHVAGTRCANPADPLNPVHRFAALVFNFNFRANVGDAFQSVQRCSGGGDVVGLSSDCKQTSATVLSADENRNTQSDSLFAAAPHTASTNAPSLCKPPVTERYVQRSVGILVGQEGRLGICIGVNSKGILPGNDSETIPIPAGV
jgi:hypothetical protein